ncbi:MAG: hypothetical protein M3280_08800 [Actinomycetota bacterium]|nr:hypothetical protein [Actinomycetota bacterium]
MSAADLLVWGSGAVIGFATALLWVAGLSGRADPRLVRTNVSGMTVPAVLGMPLVAGSLNGLFVVAVIDRFSAGAPSSVRSNLALATVVAACWVAGYVDDLRGEERTRGFLGHFRALASARLTGGLVKIALVGAAGVAAGLLLGDGRFVVECALLIGLTANLVNLLDRAPGRAGKLSLVGALVLVLVAPPAWTVGTAGLMGALVVCLPVDLKERAMLGDAGANPLGAILGLGLTMALSEPGRLIALVVLLALNLASERWSFSKVIESNRFLGRADRVGRK